MISFGIHFYPTGIKPEIAITIPVIWGVAEYYNKYVTLSSAIDRTHKPKSLHYVGLALDIYWDDFNLFNGSLFRDELKERLGKHYDVVLEDDHVHVEYQPKEPINAHWRN